MKSFLKVFEGKKEVKGWPRELKIGEVAPPYVIVCHCVWWPVGGKVNRFTAQSLTVSSG